MPVAVATHAACPTCRGTGAEPGTAPSVCPLCQGRGVESQGQGLFSITRPCTRCNGTGTVIEKPVPRPATAPGARASSSATGSTSPPASRTARASAWPARARPGLRGGAAGDLYVVTRVTESPVFRRKGDHLEVDVPITVVEALRGAEVEVPTLDGTKRLRVAAGTPHGTLQRLRGEGPPKLDGGGRATSTTAS